MAASTEEWVRIHERVLDCVRAAIDGLSDEELHWKAPGTGMSIAGDVSHICDAERYWMGEVGFQSDVPRVGETSAMPELVAALDAAEAAHERLLGERPGDGDVLYGLGRVCLHALNHLGRIAYFRMRHQPEWNYPEGTELHGAFDLIIGAMVK